MIDSEKNKKLQRIFNSCVEQLNSIEYYPDVSCICFNTKITRIHGGYYEDDRHIEISYKMFCTNTEDAIYEVVMHELAHNLDHILNSQCSEDLDGHGDSWQKIANDINQKLGTHINRYSEAESCYVLLENVKHNYVVKCNRCGVYFGITSKFSSYDKVRKRKCEKCGCYERTLIGKGELGFNFATGNLFIRSEDGKCVELE